jgi:hypothetical protein
MTIIIPLLICAVNINWTFKPDMQDWETKSINGKIETVQLQGAACVKLTTTSARKNFVVIRRQINDVKIGDKIEITAEAKADTSRAKLVVSGGFKWGEKVNGGQYVEKRYSANYVWTKLRIVVKVKKLPLYVNLGIYKAKNKYLLLKNVSIKPFSGKVASKSELKSTKINLPGNLPKGSWEKIITENKGSLSKINNGIRLFADTADSWVALRQKNNKFKIGEEIIFSAEVKAPTENAQLIVTDGFIWGEAVKNRPYHKTKHSGSGEWEKLQARLTVSSNMVCVGLGMSRGCAKQWLEARNIKITREREIIPSQVKNTETRLQKSAKNSENPLKIQNYCKKTLIELRKRFAAFKQAEDAQIITCLKSLRETLIKAETPVFLSCGVINPEKIKLDSEKSIQIEIYNISRAHSIYMKINAPGAKIKEIDPTSKTKFGLLEGSLFQVPDAEPAILEISANQNVICELLPLDHNSGDAYRKFTIQKWR